MRFERDDEIKSEREREKKELHIDMEREKKS